ncbi:MAG: lysylphosphatidylglycerol synthase domain-containing protein, partial [Longimicrobiales bacterium]
WAPRPVAAAVVVAGLLGLLALALLLRRPLARWPRRLRRPLARGLVALRRLSARPATLVLAFALSFGIQSGFVLLNVVIGRSLGITAPVAAWFMAWPLAKLVGLLPISLGGLGVRDAAFATLLLPFGVAASQGVVASLVWDSVLIVGGLLGGLVWWTLGRQTKPAPQEQPRPDVVPVGTP